MCVQQKFAFQAQISARKQQLPIRKTLCTCLGKKQQCFNIGIYKLVNACIFDGVGFDEMNYQIREKNRGNRDLKLKLQHLILTGKILKQ